MKKMLAALVLGILLFKASPALANEGVANLSDGSSDAKCYLTSIYEDGRFQVLMTCRGLNVALNPKDTFYMAWIEDANGNATRLGEIERGKLTTSIDKEFVKILVTAETNSTPRKPSEKIILSGDMREIPFGTDTGKKLVEEKVPSVTPTAAAVKKTETKAATSSSPVGSILRTVGRVVGILVLVLIVAGVVLTVVTRRKEV